MRRMSEKAYDVVIVSAGIVKAVVVEWDLAREEFADRHRSSF
jgi:hypothetical protein